VGNVTKLQAGAEVATADEGRPIEDFTIDELRAMAQDLKSEEYHRGQRSKALQERYHQLLGAQQERTLRELRPISPANVSAIGYAYAMHTVLLPIGTPKERITDPALWCAVPPQILRPFVQLYAIEPEKYFAHLLVRSNDEGGQLELLVLDSWDLPAAGNTPWFMLPPGYDVRPVAGSSLQQVWYHRAPGDEVPIGPPELSRDLARQRAIQHARTVSGATAVYG
jgi:hypothetical protein